jgi:hypothetical protein
MITYKLLTVRIQFEGEEWTRYETKSMIQYSSEDSHGKSYMFSG